MLSRISVLCGVLLSLTFAAFGNPDPFCRGFWLEASDRAFNKDSRGALFNLLAFHAQDSVPPEKTGIAIDPLFAEKPSIAGKEKIDAALTFLEDRFLDPKYVPASPATRAVVDAIRQRYEKGTPEEKTAIKHRLLFFMVKEKARLFEGSKDQRNLALMRLDQAIWDDPGVQKARESKPSGKEFDDAAAADEQRRKELGMPRAPRQGDRTVFDRMPIDYFRPIDNVAVGEVNPTRGQ